MKKIIAVFLASCMLLTAIPAVSAESKLSEGGFDYSLINDGTEICIDYYSGSDTDVTIPEQIAGLDVTMVGTSAFMFKKIESIVLPDKISVISSVAFNGCTNLESITLPREIRVIGSEAFQGCCALKEINLPDGLEFIWSKAFFGCDSLCAVDIPASVQTIGASAFSECDALVEVHIAEGVKTIENNAFSWNVSREYRRIFIPDSVTTIYNRSVYNATAYLNGECYAASVLNPADICDLQKLGDLDNDGKKSVSDVILLRSVIIGYAWINRGGVLCDIDIDGKITIADVVALRQEIINGNAEK